MANKLIERTIQIWVLEAQAKYQNENWLTPESQADAEKTIAHWFKEHADGRIGYQAYVGFMESVRYSIEEEIYG